MEYCFLSLIIGSHPQQPNFLFANGSSGHGLQHAPAIGRAISEYLSDWKYHSIDLSRFGFQRIVNNTPIFEPMIV
jgi:glycine/D-amino acid oxidase-like deaminating enzyme